MLKALLMAALFFILLFFAAGGFALMVMAVIGLGLAWKQDLKPTDRPEP